MDDRPSVLLLVGDAMRRDALSVRDGSGSTSALAQRLESWIHLHRCCAAAPWTLPSSTSLLSGTDAITHERFSNRDPMTVPSLVEQVDLPHRVAIFDNSVLTRKSGLGGGFEKYRFVHDSDEVFTTARAFLDERRADGEPFFLMVHSNIVHDYYLASSRQEYERYYPDRHDYVDIRYRVLSWRDVTDRADTIRRIYDATVLRLHDEFESLVQAAPLDRTIVVVLADHGEGFEPQLARIHHGGRVHDDLVRIPCVFHLPPIVPDDVRARVTERAEQVTGSIDVLPTLIDLVGGSVPVSIDGLSLARACQPSTGGAPEERRVLRIEDRRYLYLRNRLRLNTNAKGKNMTARARARNWMWRATVAREHSVQGFVDGHLKLVVTRARGRNAAVTRAGQGWLRRLHNGEPLTAVRDATWFAFELFDLDADPGERTNLLAGATERVDAILDVVERYERGDFTPRLDALAPTAA